MTCGDRRTLARRARLGDSPCVNFARTGLFVGFIIALTAACGSSAVSESATPDGGGGAAGVGGATAGSGGSGLAGGSGGAAGAGGSGALDAGADTGVDATVLPGAPLGTFKLTYYWVTTEEEFTGAQDTPLYASNCSTLATVRAKFAAALAIEGTGRLLDGRIVNYDGACSCPKSPCYFEADASHPWGYGVQNLALAPFRSVAVDKAEVAIGTRLYIAELDGVAMPGDAPWGNFVHDGCVTAHDVGGGIQGKHLDFFSALKIHYQSLDGALGLSNVSVFAGGDKCP